MNRLRCAIYTRKSSEEGLEQEFNSLHAQREASEAFIKSQKHEGWHLISTAYDDCGISGGTMARPALQRLLSDIKEHTIDVIVVYKVDRLTRLLADFAKMVEVFDKHKVSFVSVTQQFNTTSSMGRLTLNVLLSFAQFEREVTGERIRDKVAASKKKGMWMGGVVPLGYRAENRQLVLHPEEAALVRWMMEQYLASGCVRRLQEVIDARNIRTRSGYNFSRGMLYGMLANPIYIGKIRHQGICYDGMHEAIIPQELWEKVQAQLNAHSVPFSNGRRTQSAYLLLGKLYDALGTSLTTNHATKQGKRYHYYVFRQCKGSTTEAMQQNNGWRIPAPMLEQHVCSMMNTMLRDESALHTTLSTKILPQHWQQLLDTANTKADALQNPLSRPTILSELLHRVELQQNGITITLNMASLLPAEEPILMQQHFTMQMQRRGVEMHLVIADTNTPCKVDPVLARSVARAYGWWEQLLTGKVNTMLEIAAHEKVNPSYIGDVMKLAFLSPEIVESILAGKHPADLTSVKLIRRIHLPLDWTEQKQLLKM